MAFGSAVHLSVVLARGIVRVVADFAHGKERNAALVTHAGNCRRFHVKGADAEIFLEQLFLFAVGKENIARSEPAAFDAAEGEELLKQLFVRLVQ